MDCRQQNIAFWIIWCTFRSYCDGFTTRSGCWPTTPDDDTFFFAPLCTNRPFGVRSSFYELRCFVMYMFKDNKTLQPSKERTKNNRDADYNQSIPCLSIELGLITLPCSRTTVRRNTVLYFVAPIFFRSNINRSNDFLKNFSSRICSSNLGYATQYAHIYIGTTKTNLPKRNPQSLLYISR